MHLDLILYVQLRVEVHRDVFSNREYGVMVEEFVCHHLVRGEGPIFDVRVPLLYFPYKFHFNNWTHINSRECHFF